ncbi:MAG: hypothetical protein K8S21_09095 [Gemmatimonadetes bacterium]|nr:hypothetical protein [Gemmatimonadota bacterium]
MVCAVCNKESNNRRVCPFCFTPYPADAPQSRQSTATGRQSTGTTRQSTAAGKASWPGDRQTAAATGEGGGAIGGAVERARAFVMRQTPLVRWSAAGIVVVLILWTTTGGSDEKKYAAGSVPSNIIATPMQREEAIALLKRTRETALVDMQSDEVFVSYPAATFPLLAEGQIALAQQFARADEIVEGRKRRIFFYNPSGRIFAQSDGVTGVTVK